MKTILLALCAALLFCPESLPGAETTVREGRVLAGGRPFFPLGLYHVSFYGTRERKIADLKEIAAAGFNLVDFSLDEGDAVSLQAAGQLGLQVLPEFNADPHALVRAFRDNPAVFGWSIADDADSGRHTPMEITGKRDAVKALDPKHLAYISCGAHSAEYAACADAIGVQVYPVGSSEWGSDPLDLVFKILEPAVVHASGAGHVVFANLQCARVYKNKRAPEISDVRNMTYQALIAGVQGILYYTYFDQTWDLAKHPGLWAGMKALAGELTQHTAYWTQGRRTRLAAGSAHVLAARWDHASGTLLAIVSTDPERRTAADVPLELAASPAAQIPAGDWTLRGGRLTGTLKPLDVQIFHFPSLQPAERKN